MKPLDPITYDYSGLVAARDASQLVRQTGVVEADLKWLAPRLAAARQETLDNLVLYQRGGPVPDDLQPIDVGFFDLPERLMNEERLAHGANRRRRRPIGEGGGSGGGAGHWRIVHGRQGTVRSLLPSLPQRDFRGSGAAGDRASTSKATTSTTTRCRDCWIWSKATMIGAS